MTCKIKINI